MKAAWKSKTEVVNTIVVVATIIEMTLAKGLIPIPPQTQVLILGIINVVLRFFTHDSIGVKNAG